MSSSAISPTSSAWQVVQPLISLVGGIFVWIGVWDYIIDYLHGNTAAYDWGYMLLGLAFLVLTRTVIAQAGLKPITYTAPTSSTSSSPTIVATLISFLANTTPPPTTPTLVTYVRSLLALLAGIVFWLGAYNLFDLHLYEFGSLWRDVAYCAVGLAVMFLTSNVTSEGTLISDNADPTLASSSTVALLKSPTTVLSTTRGFLWYHAKALVGLFGDVVYWVGAYNLADSHLWPATVTRDSLYVVLGLLVFLGVSLWTFRERMEVRAIRAAAKDGGGAFAPLAGGSGGAAGHVGMGDRLAFYLRCVVAMVAGIIVWVGWWNVLSTWVVSDGSESIPADGNEEAGVAEPSPGVRRRLLAMAVDGPYALRFHVLQRSSTTETAFPMWVLYLMYAFTGMVFLVVTNTFASQAGVIQPLGLIRQQANVGVTAEQANAEAPAAGGVVASDDPDQRDAQAEVTPAFRHALPSN